MGVYIKGMEMPKDKAVAVVIHPDGTAYTAEMFAGVCTEYLSDCTAVPVPTHEDLIDRREAIIDANERAYDFWLSDDEVNATIRFLNEQTTIIPAEEGE